jgi:predicted nucleotide-binding protein
MSGCALLRVDSVRRLRAAVRRKVVAPEVNTKLWGAIMAETVIKPSLFIGSSSEGIEFARAVRSLLTEDAEVTVWKEGLFGLGSTYIETLVNALPRFDFAILVFTPDDLVTSRELDEFGPRDNVIFELGLFMGHLGRSRTFIMYQENAQLKIPTDLSGVTMATYEWPRVDQSHKSAVGPACDSIREVIRDLGFSETKTAKEISGIRSRQEEQAHEIKLLRFFIENFIGKYELQHLEGLDRGRPYPFDSVPQTFEDELIHLRSFRLINHFEGKGIVAMKREGQGDLHDHFYITESGRNYLKLRRDVSRELNASAESSSE